jgi:SSS family solute:Na+ symporter
MNLSLIDYIVICVLLLITFFSGIFGSRSSKSNDENYILAGRKLTIPLFVATLVATWYGSILGVGEFIYNYGTLAWVCLAFPYYISALIFALFFSGKIRAINVLSIPDQLEKNYGKKVGILSSLIILIITLPSAYVLMLGVVISDIFSIGLNLSIILGTIFAFTYIYRGGFKSDVYANVSQFFIMYFGFGILLFFLIKSYGSPFEMFENLPVEKKYVLNFDNLPYIISWFFIALQTFIDPSFFQRCSASIDKNTAKKGILYSVLFWILFDFLTLFTGLYAINTIKIDEPIQVYILLGENVLPVFFKGIFYSAIIATIMSSLNSYGFLSAITIGNDIIKQIKPSIKNPTKLGLIISSVLSIIIAIYIPSVIDIFYKTASLTIPSIFFPLILSYNGKIKIKQNMIIYYMLICFLTSLIGLYFQDSQNSFFQPMQFGLLVSLILLFIMKERN